MFGYVGFGEFHIPADSICTTRLRNAVSLLTWSYARLRRIINRYMPFSRTGCGVGITVQILELRSGFQTTFCLPLSLPQKRCRFGRFRITDSRIDRGLRFAENHIDWNNPFPRVEDRCESSFWIDQKPLNQKSTH